MVHLSHLYVTSEETIALTIQNFVSNHKQVSIKKTEIISSIFTDHNSIRPDISYKEKIGKKHKHVECKQHSTKQPMGHRKNKGEHFKVSGNKWK